MQMTLLRRREEEQSRMERETFLWATSCRS